MALIRKLGVGMAAAAFAMTLAVASGEAQRRHWAGDGCDHGTNRSYGRSVYNGGGYYDSGYNDSGYNDSGYDRGYRDNGYYNRGRTYRSSGYSSYYPRTYQVYRSYPRYSRSHSRSHYNRGYSRSYYNRSYNSYGSYPRYSRYPRRGLSISVGLGF